MLEKSATMLFIRHYQNTKKSIIASEDESKNLSQSANLLLFLVTLCTAFEICNQDFTLTKEKNCIIKAACTLIDSPTLSVFFHVIFILFFFVVAQPSNSLCVYIGYVYVYARRLFCLR